MFWLKYVQNLINILNQDASPAQIAAGFALGAMAGLIPKFTLLSLALWALIFLVRVNISMAALGAGVFAILGAFTDSLAERLGYWLLTGIPAFRGIWTSLYNTPVVPWTAFNNTLVLGNLTAGLLIAVPLYFAAHAFVLTYRARLRDKVAQWKVMQAFKASKLYELYERFRGE